MKGLYIALIILGIFCVVLSTALLLTTEATVTNDIAIDQLNGGDAAYIEMQLHNLYRDRLITACYAVSATAAILIGIITYKEIKNFKNSKEN